MKNKLLFPISFALAACFYASNVDAQTQLVLKANQTWIVPEVVINAPGSENAYLIVVPVAPAGDQTRAYYIETGRDDSATTDKFTRYFPINGQTRRAATNLNSLFDATLHIFHVRVDCPGGCVVSVIQRKDGQEFWEGKTLNALPVATLTVQSADGK